MSPTQIETVMDNQMEDTGRVPSGQALAVPATPASAVDGPSGFGPSRSDVLNGLDYLLERFAEGDEFCDAGSEILANARSFVREQIDWRSALKEAFDTEGVLSFLAKGVRTGGWPMGQHGMISWSTWLISVVERCETPKADTQ